MTIKERLQAIFKKENLTDKAKAGELNSDDWKNVAESYKKEHGTDMYDDIAADKSAQKDEAEQARIAAEKAAAHDAALELLNAQTNGGEQTDGAGDEKQQTTLEDSVRNLTNQVNSNQKENKELRDALNKLNPENVETVNLVVNATGIGLKHSETHLFGSKSPMYAVGLRCNQLFLNPGAIHGMADASKEEQEAFFSQVNAFSSKVGNAIRGLHAAGQLNPELLRSADNPNLDALTNADLGDQFVIMRTREILARVFELPDIFGIFPLRSGIQDRELITNAFVSELTQPFQDSESALKGSASLDPEMGYVDDAMILSKFGSYKEIERRYIGYLNTNGSDPVKFGMIEYTLLLYMMQARKELMTRLIQGIFCKPVDGTPGHFLTASTGVLNRIKLYSIERKVRALVDDTLNTYDNTGTVFIDALIEFANWLIENVVPLGINQSDIRIYANANHKQWFKTGYRSKYALHGDFTGTETATIPDTEIGIVWVPNMAANKMFWATTPGNMQCLENVPGEMYKFYLERRLNNVYAQATWKEGTSAGFAGLQSDSEAALAERAWDKQMIWFPKPYVDLAADATTANANNGSWFITGTNTAAKALTDISNKAAGVLYIVECGDITFPTTIAKAALFASIKEAYTPTAVGDAIGLVWDANASLFREIFRKVGGTLSYYATTSPNAGRR